LHLHVKSKFHFLVKISYEDSDEILYESLLGNIFDQSWFFLLLWSCIWRYLTSRWLFIFCGRFSRLITHLSSWCNLGKHIMQSIINDSWKLSVLYKVYLIKMLLLIGSHQKVRINILEVWSQLFIDELLIKFCIEIFYLYILLVIKSRIFVWWCLTCILHKYYLGLLNFKTLHFLGGSMLCSSTSISKLWFVLYKRRLGAIFVNEALSFAASLSAVGLVECSI
jgi:hypothetical protein